MTTDDEPPLLLADGLSLRTKRGWVYRNIDLRLPPGSVTAVAGPTGSGRSMLLLTLAGRATPTGGRLTVAGEQDRDHIRQLVAVARITGGVELEPEMRVVDHIQEAELLGARDHRAAATALGLDLDPTALVADLPTDDAVLFSVALVLAGRPRAVVVDDVDIAATPHQQHRIWTALTRADVTVIASTVDGRLAAAAGATVVEVGSDARA